MLETTTRDLQPQSLQSLADKAATLYARGTAAWMECAYVLHEARPRVTHGEWGKFLAEVGIPESTARRMLKVARTGIKSATLADLNMSVTDLLDMQAAAEQAQDIWRRFVNAEWLKDERGAILSAFPDGPISVTRWNDFAASILDDGPEVAWEKRPWAH